MRLCVVAGEASGDLHASEVVRELKLLVPELELFGVGGDRLEREGMRLIRHARDLAIVGLFNVVAHLPMFLRTFRDLVRTIERERPDAVLLVDYPDFNLRVARRCKELGIPVVYYISPQIWAWRKRRVRQIAERVRHMLVIFPFETELYERNGVAVTYVGHPLGEQLAGIPRRSEDAPLAPYRIALMPGSRRMEVATLLGPMVEAVAELRAEREIEVFLLIAPTVDRDIVDRVLVRAPLRPEIIERGRMQTLATCDLALCSSGTATLEAAVLGVPPVVVYRLTRLTYALARRLVTLPHFSLVNIVAGREVVPELIQDQVSGKRIAAEARKLLEPSRWSEVRRDLDEVRERLGGPGASRRAAEKIATLIQPSGTATR